MKSKMYHSLYKIMKKNAFNGEIKNIVITTTNDGAQIIIYHNRAEHRVIVPAFFCQKH